MNLYDAEKIADALEYLQKEKVQLQNSRAYRIGTKVENIINNISISQTFDAIKCEIKYRKINKFGCKIEVPLDNFHYGSYPIGKKFIVYTCITGGYDDLLEPIYVHPDIKYIAFTDSTSIKSDIWEIRPIPDNVASLNDNTLINRYFKFHSHVLFSGFDYALYIDGNIRIVSDVRNITNRINSKTGLAFHRHNSRNCIYKEAEVCRIEKRGNYKKICEQLDCYRKQGLPGQFGLYEANIFMTDLKNENASKILNSWWEEFINSGSFRDQIVLPYVVWKCGFQFDDIGNLGINMHNNPKFEKVRHLESKRWV